MARACLSAIAASVTLLLAVPAAARSSLDLIRYEQGCPQGSEPRSLRQTIVVLDESVVSAQADVNQRWTRMIVDAADARDGQGGTLAARERFTLLVARRDGSEMVPLFIGCSPNQTSDEIARRKSGDSMLDRFFGNDVESRRQKARSEFSGALARALAQVQKQSAEIAAEPIARGAFVKALQNAGRLADPDLGLARFVLITPFAVTDNSQLRDVPAARSAGFALAERSGVDFGRSEVYLAGAALGDGPLVEFVRAFVLGSRGNLVAARSDALPRFAPEPVSVRVFSGFIDYVGQRVPLQMRLALGVTGELVNSWLETTFVRPVATPIEGKAICRGPDSRAQDNCEIQGRDRFARVWLLDPQGEPAERGKFPFGAARNIDVRVQGGAATGVVSDPKVTFRGETAAKQPIQMDELRFELQRVDGGQF